jgi:Divergent InlB B-repeat domain
MLVKWHVIYNGIYRGLTTDSGERRKESLDGYGPQLEDFGARSPRSSSTILGVSEMQSSRRTVLAIAICLLSVLMFASTELKAAGLPQSGAGAPPAAVPTAAAPPASEQSGSPAGAQQETSPAAAQSGATQSQASPQKPQAVAPPPENKSGYRDPDWGPKRQLKQKAASPAVTGPYQTGQVFVSDGSGDVDIFQPDGTMIGTLTTGQTLSAGMAFDRSGNLYVSTFGLPTGVVEFDVNGNVVGPFGTFPTADADTAFPESVLVTSSGNIFVGAATSAFECSDGAPTPTPVPAFEFSAAGALLNTFNVLSECRGTDWVELLADQKTLLYTSEGLSIKSFNISTGAQNPDFVDNLPGASAYAFRQLPDGTVLVADSTVAIRLSAAGAILATYTPSTAVSSLFALNLDPDGVSFWTADLETGSIFRFDIASGTQVSTFVSPTAFASGLAIFGEKTAGNNNLTITVGGSGAGQVVSTPPGLSCPAVCVAPFPDNSSITITATPAAGSTLASFSANCVPANPQTTPPTCIVPIVTSDVTVTATFNTSSQVALAVTETGTGTGTVTSVPSGISCMPTCSANFASGTVVTLTAAPATGSTFTGWSGANSCEGTGTCTFTITAATSVTATFGGGTTNFALTVTEAGTGTGTVASAPAGINCKPTCNANFVSGTQVTLTAKPATGSTFTGWSAPCEGTGTCTVTITAATTVTANFGGGTTNFALTVTEAGSGTGTVTSTPAGINCMPTCSASFASGTQVTLTATPATGSTFTGWSAPCEGTGTCTVTITAATAVTATFSSPTGVVVTVPSGGTTTATTTPGGTAFFGLQISGGTGVTGTVQLGCSSSSPFITCTVIPSTITLNGGTTEVAFGIQTFCQGATTTVGFVPGGFGGGISFGLLALLLAGISGMFSRNRRVTVAFAMLMIVMALGTGSCASLPKGASGATPAGTYNITLTTTLKGNTQTLPNFLTLVVK